MIKNILVNSITGKERIVTELPGDYVFQDGESLVQRDLTIEELFVFQSPKLSNFRIERYVPDSLKDVPIQFINYKNQLDNSLIPAGSLIPSRTFMMGELKKIIWYCDTEKLTPVIEVIINYTRTLSGIAKERVTDRYWYKEDGTKYLLKTTDKIYEPLDSIREWERRRKNALGAAKMSALGLSYYLFLGEDPAITEKRGNDYLASLQVEISNFIENGTKDLRDAILNNTTENWLNWPFSEHPAITKTFPFKGTTKLKEVIASDLDIWQELNLPLYMGQ